MPGRLFIPSNGYYLERDTGSAWSPWGPLYTFTVPVDGDFAWINQGGASVSAVNGGIFLRAPATADSSLRIRKKTAPITPYTITAAVLLKFPTWINTGEFPTAGLCWRESSSGKIITMGIYLSGTDGLLRLQLGKWDSPTAFSAGGNYALGGCHHLYGAVIWFRLEDDGTNRKVYCSMDGINFLTADHSVGRTDYMTANEVGFFVNAGQATFDAGITLLSWLQG